MGKICPVVKKMSNIKKVKHLDYWRGLHKKNSHNDVHTYWCQFWCQIWRSPKLVKNTFHGHFEGFWWWSYVTSKLTSISMNLIMSIYFLWTSSIVNVFFYIWHHFDNLTSFNIFITCICSMVKGNNFTSICFTGGFIV